MRKISTITFMLLLSGFLYGQGNHWSDIKASDISAAPSDRLIVPNKSRTLHLNLSALKSLLTTVPQEAEFVAGEAGVSIEFPLPNDAFSSFEVWEAPVMHPDLTAQYPEIRSYAGRNKQGDYIRFDVTPKGFHGMVLTTDRSKTYYMDPYAVGNTSNYNCYLKSEFTKPVTELMDCLVSDSGVEETEMNILADRAGSCGNLRTYRLAFACTGEYANFHGSFGADKAPALAALATSLTRLNSVFEIDCNLRMVMVANNANVIYTNPATDPYNNNASNMLSQNITTCNAQIGSGNYDIGHVLAVFPAPGNGVAYLNAVCTTNKAGGVTGHPNPVGDPLDIDFTAHEMGHQFGAEHTQYNNCNRSSASAMEPGSASSIMGYAGICSPNVQSNSDPYFHARNIGQIAAFINGAGNACSVLLPNGNNSPTCNALVNKTIPKSTPFVLTAVGSDPDGDALSYCWEQMDAFKSPAQPMPPTSTNKTGPVFRTLNPSSAPSRYFPLFADVLNNTSGTWEKLPSISRALNFRVTLRDNHANGGCTTEQNTVVTVTANAGPFAVTQPNTAVNWFGNSAQTITWSVAGTTANGVNCANVDILISTNGGASFTTLLANTPNDGTQAVTIPNTATSQARILVQAVGNIFYDVSNVNFTITGVQPNDFGNTGNHFGETLVVFPNPSTDFIQVHAPAAWHNLPLQLRIWNMEGRIVLEESAFISGNSLTVRSLDKGTYQIEVMLNGEKLLSTMVRQ